MMEELTGGELFDRLVTLGKYTEEDARYFTFKLLNAVLYLHDREICHRDLKPENILLASKAPDAELKITDFGLSKIVAIEADAMMSTRCGTPGYVAPEVLSGGTSGYGTACDMWSVGVIVYILLCAAPPFYGKTDDEMNTRIKGGSFKFPPKYWAHVSHEAKDFISRLLTVDPSRRMNASEALQHDWIVGIGVHTDDLFHERGPASVPVMQARFDEFNYERRASHLHRAGAPSSMKEIFALSPDEDELHHFRCTHAERTGHLLVTTAHVGFLAYDQSSMFTLPIIELCRVSTARLMEWSASSDNSMRLYMSNGSTVQFDGFWERDSCIELLRACARFLQHEVEVVLTETSTEAAAVSATTPTPAASPTAAATATVAAAAAATAVPAPASASGRGSALAAPATAEPAAAQPALEVAAAATQGLP